MGILAGKVALLSGGSRGIGRAIAEKYYEEGAKLYILSRHEDEITRAAAEIDRNKEGRVIGLACDVSSEEQVNAVIDTIKKNGDCVEILVNCAGINLRGPLAEMPMENWDKVMAVNLTGAFLLSKACYPMMKQLGRGKIVNIASLMSEIGRPTIAPYTASKGGIKMFSRAAAVEWAKDNIQVNAIIPGYIATDINVSLQQDENFNRYICERTPAGRWGRPDEIAATALFLVSRGADFITGTEIAVDGGILAAL
ncbi:MAG TPA: SDR family oxidoreductase [Candidatus Anaerobiospirillum pullistercoris]|uniref:SDR family oxidoreductase n=1 Tax=Candidatus Anaerobiospirillum pullistercoris TaxID=2838452 RepID=A0A9D1WF69_9GAMM|nr:SDR family oxidoreductase [Candidatus Anaerobiospirillum pullistercoris]